VAKLAQVSKPEWKAFFDRVSKSLVNARAEIEVASLDLGDQVVAEWVPLLGLSYDPRADRLDIVLARSNHAISGPKEISVQESAEGLETVAIVDKEGARQVVKLKKPLLLPAAIGA